MNIAEAITNYKETKQRFMEELQEGFKTEFKRIFDECPNLGAITWEQYTPYFNDGEPCEFSVHTFTATNSDDVEANGMVRYGEFYADDWDEEEVGEFKVYDSRDPEKYTWMSDERREEVRKEVAESNDWITPEEQAKVDEFLDVMQDSELEDIYKATFGDHVKVIATRDGFDVSDYDHD